MSFRTGTFLRERTGPLRPFCPARAVVSLLEVDLDLLKSDGKKLILLDVDHTLVEWKQEDFSPEVIAWLERAKALGFDLCILSNTRRVERLARVSEKLGVPTLRGKFKPSRQMYLMALEKFNAQPEEAIMIGDQIMTDILGANRTGIDAIWVRKMHGPEFFGTKFNRVIEKVITSFLYRSLVTDPTERDEAPKPLWERAIVRQFAKFLCVGAISFMIDYAIRHFLLFKLSNGGQLVSEIYGAKLQASMPAIFGGFATPIKAFFPIAAICASFVATFNSFLLNRAFTFRIRETKDAGKQAVKVYIVAYIGLAINAIIGTIFNNILPHHPVRSAFLATVIGAACAAIWNFYGQRTFAFRAHKKDA
jgi:uncharacterized protein